MSPHSGRMEENMKKVFVDPEMRISYFKGENVVTLSGGGDTYTGSKYEGSQDEFTQNHSILSLDWSVDF